MFESKYSKALTVVLIIVIISIVVLLGFLAVDYIKKYSVTKQASEFVENYQQEISSSNNQENVVENKIVGNIELTEEEINSNNNGNNKANNTSNSAKKKWNNLTVVGTMKIPTIKLEYPIVEDIGTTALEKALVALYPSGDNLNRVGNTVIVGHNYRNGTFFSNIKKLSNGDKIYITDYRGTSLTYEVYNKFEADQTDASFYTRDTNGIAEITLSTCTDASNDQRTIIFAKQI